MKEQQCMRGAILLFWVFFWGLSVVDKIIPDVQHLWVGKDFFALFVKFFASLGLSDPRFATVALAGVSGLEAITFAMYVVAFLALVKGYAERADLWFFRAVFSSMGLFALFSIADQIFGDRFQLLEHGLFWMVLLASWVAFKHAPENANRPLKMGATRVAIGLGVVMSVLTMVSIRCFSKSTIHLANSAVFGQEVMDGVWKFDFPFLADKRVWESTINTFVEEHPDLEVTYIYTGPTELNSKKKTHLLLYVFTTEKKDSTRQLEEEL